MRFGGSKSRRKPVFGFSMTYDHVDFSSVLAFQTTTGETRLPFDNRTIDLTYLTDQSRTARS